MLPPAEIEQMDVASFRSAAFESEYDVCQEVVTSENCERRLEEAFNYLAAQIEDGIKKQLYGTRPEPPNEIKEGGSIASLPDDSFIEGCSSVGWPNKSIISIQSDKPLFACPKNL